MNVTAIGYQDLVEFRDTRPNLRNILVSDLNHHGVANAHEDTSPSVPACSFFGSAALERKGLLATTATGAPAVREHGGGRARRALLTQQPSGRPARSKGGEIKSLCCAAAGIIAPAFRPCGARAYPLTGVRRAAHPAAPLRSTKRPPAKLVEGYESISLLDSSSIANPRTRPAVSVFHRPFDARQVKGQSTVEGKVVSDVRNRFKIPVAQGLGALNSKPCRSTYGHKVRNIDAAKGGYGQFIRSLLMDNALGHPTHCLPDHHRFSWISFLYRSIQDILHCGQLVPDTKSQPAGRVVDIILDFPQPCSLVKVRNNPCGKNGSDRADGLYPGRANLTGIYRQHHDVGGRKYQDNARHRDRQVLPCPSPAALVPHPYHLDAQEHRPSLPAPCHHVQRGAA